MQSMVDADSPAASVVKAGQTQGLLASKSVDSVSASYDFSTALAGLESFAGWTLTIYGQQLATLARLAGRGGMYVW